MCFKSEVDGFAYRVIVGGAVAGVVGEMDIARCDAFERIAGRED